jgi:hypothetical protein
VLPVHVDVGADTGTEAVDGSDVIVAFVSPAVMDMIEAKMMADTVDFMLSDIDVGVVIDQSVGCWILDGRRFMRPR